MGKKRKKGKSGFGKNLIDGLVESLRVVNAPLEALLGKKETKQAAAGVATVAGGPAVGAAVGAALGAGDEDYQADQPGQYQVPTPDDEQASSTGLPDYWPWAAGAAGLALAGLVLSKRGK